ncbi:MAG: peptide ABC transporter substrate-binding protein [Bacteriovorax sp. MedPE-SWde]|nr:MAG: peptide ABC transporter substrate-binding protein [Bacteriovorax sp. MedPE-SWde]
MRIVKSLLLLLTLLTAHSALSAKGPVVKGGTFYYNLGSTPTTLNPLSSSDAYASRVQAYILESLLDRDVETYDWKPGLATSWKVSKDGLKFDFVLREGVKWHDGKPLTVEDVKFSFDAIVHPKNIYKTAHSKSYYENISKVEITGKNSIRFHVKNKYYRNFDVAAGLTVVPKHIYEDVKQAKKRKLNKTLVGSGAYILKKFKRGKGITLVANKKWWGHSLKNRKTENNFNKVFLRFIKDSTIAIQRLEKGDLDFNSLSAEEFVKKTKGSKWGKSVFKVKTKNKSPKGYGFIGWNMRSPLFSSKNTRKALYHLVNRGEMINKFRYGYSLPATGPVYLQSEYANQTVKAVDFNPKAALKLLRAEGWKDTDGDMVLDKMIDGKKVKFSFTILEPSKEFVKYLTMFKEDAKKAGIEVKIKFIEWNSFIKALDERNFDAVRLGWSGGSVDWDPKQVWHSSSADNKGSNFVGYKNTSVDKWIDDARFTLDKKKRKVILNKVFKQIAEDYPYVFLFNDKYLFYGHSKRMGREKDTYTYGVGLERWWITK